MISISQITSLPVLIGEAIDQNMTLMVFKSSRGDYEARLDELLAYGETKEKAIANLEIELEKRETVEDSLRKSA